MAEDIQKLGIRVDSKDVTKADTRLKKLGSTSAKTENQVTKSTSGMKNGFGVAAKAVGGMLAAVASLQTILKSVSAAREFGSAIAEVSTLIEGTDKQLDQLSESAKNLSATFGVGATKQVSAFYQAISAGATTIKEANEIVLQANKLAVGGVSNLVTATDALTTAVNVYKSAGLSAGDASDSLFTAVKFGKTTVDELGAAIGKVLPLASSLGVSFDEVTSAIAGLTKGGISTRESVTGLRAVLAAVAKPSKEASDLAKELGLNFSAAGLQARGFGGFLEELNRVTKGDVDILSQLFGGVEALVPVLAFAGDTGTYFNETLSAMATKAGATDKAFLKVAQSMDHRLNVAVEKVVNNFLTLGKVITTAVTPVIELFADNIKRIGVYLTSAVAGFVAYKAVVIASAVATGGLTTSLVVLKTALIKSGVGVLVVGLGELIYQITIAAEKMGGFGNLLEYTFKRGIDLVSRLVSWIKLFGLTLKAAFQSGIGDDGWKQTQKSIDEITAGLDRAIFKTDVFYKKLNGLQSGQGATQIPIGNSSGMQQQIQLALEQVGVSTKLSDANLERKLSVDELTSGIIKQNSALQIELDILGMSASSADVYITTKGILADASEKNIVLTNLEIKGLEKHLLVRKELLDTLEKKANIAQLFEETRTPLEIFTRQTEKLNALLKDGSIDADLYARSIERAQDAFGRRSVGEVQKIVDMQIVAADESSKVWENFGFHVQRNLGDQLFNALQGNFKSIGDAWKSLVLRMAADALAAQLTKSLFGGGGGGAGGILGGLLSAGSLIFSGLAAGGFSSVAVGGASSFDSSIFTGAVPRFADGGSHSGGLRLVGERGPELEATGRSRIYNAGQTRNILSGGREINITSNVTINNQNAGNSNKETDASSAENIGREVERSLRKAIRQEIFDDKDSGIGRGKLY